MVKRGEHVAPIPKKTPVKMTQNYGLFFSKSLMTKLMPMTLQEMKENPDRKSMMVKLIQLRLKLHKKRETEMMQVYMMYMVWVLKYRTKYLTEKLPKIKAVDLTMNMKE